MGEEERAAYKQWDAKMRIAEGCACLECWKREEKKRRKEEEERIFRPAYDQWLEESKEKE